MTAWARQLAGSTNWNSVSRRMPMRFSDVFAENHERRPRCYPPSAADRQNLVERDPEQILLKDSENCVVFQQNSKRRAGYWSEPMVLQNIFD
jgi:hypothetical protein